MGLQVKAEDGGATERFTKELHADLKFEEIDAMTAIECGFKMTWLDGSGGRYDSIVLTSGAGCGSPWGQLSLKKDGETRHFRFNAQELLESMIRSVESGRMKCRNCGRELGQDAQAISLGFCSGTCAREGNAYELVGELRARGDSLSRAAANTIEKLRSHITELRQGREEG